jgi:2,3-bisphosphoglycerate-independent phosphoglycerate mutase
MKYVVIILDGAAGWPLESLGGRTTLAAASTPNLDALAREGRVGLAVTVPPGEEPSSAAACTSILGYDPVADRVGRGAIEAASIGIVLAPDEVALRLNLVNITDGVMTSYAAGHITTEESRPIVEALQAALGDESLRLYPGVAYRHIMVVRDHPELLDVRFTPPHDISDQPVESHLPSGPGSEMLLDLMRRARPVLAQLPQNAARIPAGRLPATDVWPFWPGVRPSGITPFEELRGIPAAMTSGVDLLNGLATLTGLQRLDIPGVTDGSDNDYAAQTRGALAALVENDLVVVHVESPDEEGHAGDAARKLAAIEDIDREVVARVRDAMAGGGMRVLAMPDHPTPVAIKTHVAEPVPFVLAGEGVAANAAESYDEAAATGTGMSVDPGRGVMDLLLAP